MGIRPAVEPPVARPARRTMSDQPNVTAGLNLAHAAAPVLPIDLRDLRLVILSDLHRGAGDDADDFRACQGAFATALENYRRKDYILAILGDAEELWECRPEEVVAEYRTSLLLEKAFHDRGRYWRFLGNHDEAWQSPELVRQHLEPILGRVMPLEALRLQIVEGDQVLGEIFLVHGHQGTLWADRLAWFSHLALHHVWRPVQRLGNLKATTPATDWRMGRKHERAMYNWAVEKPGLVVIAGHTHHPAFPSPARSELLSATYDDLRHQPEALEPEVLEQFAADLAFARSQEQPCYMNTGCCSFSDGSLTGIEVAAGAIRLGRWREVQERARREVLASATLKRILAEVAAPGLPAAAP